MFRSQFVEGNVAYHKITYTDGGEIMNKLGINEKVKGERVNALQTQFTSWATDAGSWSNHLNFQ